jgi:hypothetical protein
MINRINKNCGDWYRRSPVQLRTVTRRFDTLAVLVLLSLILSCGRNNTPVAPSPENVRSSMSSFTPLHSL